MNKWDERYRNTEYVYGLQPNAFLVEQAARFLPPNRLRVLSLGEGEGRNATYLAELGHDVHAVDGSAVGLDKASQLAASRSVKITTQVCDLATYQLNGTYDLIIMIFCHLPSTLRANIHQQIFAGLNPGGWLIYQAYSPNQLRYGTGGPGDVDMLVSLNELTDSFSPMHVLHACTHEREIKEGILHTGMADVTEFVARK
ncbi:class I SAM-dependent methyltransferase [Musicola keenii]|uniref:class I SAM-dependent methyltransferase n=1 Tax=Musicola keenii TaxID=2884250 RepID=UPI00177E2027